MAEVYLSVLRGAAGFEKRLVIKKILPIYTDLEEFTRLFTDEARISVSLNHSHIVQVFDFGVHAGEHFIAMEYVDGPDLEKLLIACRKLRTQLSVESILYVATRVAAALEYAHTRVDDQGRALELVHRDISPPNVLLSVGGDVKITDFGVAKYQQRLSKSRPGVVRGKYAYMSPEQLTGRSLDHRSDLFSLGTVLYEMTTGRNPFLGDTDYQTMEAVVGADPASPLTLRARAPRDLVRIIQRCLAGSPDARYQDATELRRDLAELMFNRGVIDDPALLLDEMWRLFPRQLQRRGPGAPPRRAAPPPAPADVGKPALGMPRMRGGVGITPVTSDWADGKGSAIQLGPTPAEDELGEDDLTLPMLGNPDAIPTQPVEGPSRTLDSPPRPGVPAAHQVSDPFGAIAPHRPIVGARPRIEVMEGLDPESRQIITSESMPAIEGPIPPRGAVARTDPARIADLPDPVLRPAPEQEPSAESVEPPAPDSAAEPAAVEAAPEPAPAEVARDEQVAEAIAAGPDVDETDGGEAPADLLEPSVEASEGPSFPLESMFSRGGAKDAEETALSLSRSDAEATSIGVSLAEETALSLERPTDMVEAAVAPSGADPGAEPTDPKVAAVADGDLPTDPKVVAVAEADPATNPSVDAIPTPAPTAAASVPPSPAVDPPAPIAPTPPAPAAVSEPSDEEVAEDDEGSPWGVVIAAVIVFVLVLLFQDSFAPPDPPDLAPEHPVSGVVVEPDQGAADVHREPAGTTWPEDPSEAAGTEPSTEVEADAWPDGGQVGVEPDEQGGEDGSGWPAEVTPVGPEAAPEADVSPAVEPAVTPSPSPAAAPRATPTPRPVRTPAVEQVTPSAAEGERVEAATIEVTLTSRPLGAQLTLDGRDVGRAPHKIRVAPGSIIEVSASLDGYLKTTRMLRVDDELEVIELTRAEETPAPLGSLSITSEPWAYVIVDGKHTGRVTPTTIELSAGQHVIVLENPEASWSRRKSVEVVSGETVSLDVAE